MKQRPSFQSTQHTLNMGGDWPNMDPLHFFKRFLCFFLWPLVHQQLALMKYGEHDAFGMHLAKLNVFLHDELCLHMKSSKNYRYRLFVYGMYVVNFNTHIFEELRIYVVSSRRSQQNSSKYHR